MSQPKESGVSATYQKVLRIQLTRSGIFLPLATAGQATAGNGTATGEQAAAGEGAAKGGEAATGNKKQKAASAATIQHA